ncbi:hypothetical protein BC941DRAFT_442582 [Chlamydoabsidia padenii]|nr:hypothetical protein BC941DRAFT_442582 [Chlamydoabsidia padenii]
MYHHILEMVGYSCWDDETEAGYINYWKPLLQTLFRNTDIKLRTGETSCVATKYDRQLNESEHGNSSKGITGRKMDLLVVLQR